MQRLDIGKAFEDGRHHHGTICSKTHCQAEGLHTCEHCARAWCNPSLQCTKFNKIDHTLNSTSLQSEQNGTTGGSRSTMMTVPPISSWCCAGSRYPSMRSLEAIPILILVRKPLVGLGNPRTSHRISRSRQGAFTTAMLSTTEAQICTHRRLRPTRRNPLKLPWRLRISSTGLLATRESMSPSSTTTLHAADAELAEVGGRRRL